MTRRIRVLIVGINFRPEHTGIAPYTTQLCEYLAHRGARVLVLAGVPHYPAWTVMAGFRNRFKIVETGRDMEIRRLWHHVPRRQSAWQRAFYELSFALHVWGQRLTERPDVVLAVTPSLLGAVSAGRIADRAGAPFAVWVQDMMSSAASQSGIEGGLRVARFVGWIERRVLRKAARVFVLNHLFVRRLEALGIRREIVEVHPNWTHIAATSTTDREAVRKKLKWASNEIIVLHTGNMGLKQDLANVVASAKLADCRSDVRVRFVLMGNGSQRGCLMDLADGVRSIQFCAPVSESDYVDVLCAADLLLVNERSSSIDMCLPSKLTSYFRAGRPVIAASPAEGGTAAEVRASGGGVLVTPGRPDRLLSAVMELGSDPERMRALGAAGRRYAARDLDANRSLERLFAAVDELAGRQSGR